MKHVGKMKNNSARVVTVFRTLPGDHTNCLVVGTQGLTDSYHDSLMSLIESETGQQANELADILAVRKFPDGSNMLNYLHVNGLLRKVSTTMVLMTPSTQVQIPLDELNELIATQKGTTVDKLSVNDGKSISKNESKKAEIIDSSIITDSLPINLTPAEMRSRADALYKEAAKLRKEADDIDPPKKKSKAEKAEA